MNEVYVMWETAGNETTDLGVSTVQYGISSGHLDQEAVSFKTSSYTVNDMCGRPANLPVQVKGKLFEVKW